MASILDAFGLAITVTRPDDEAVVTTGVWLPPLDEAQPVGTDYQRLGPRLVMAIPITATLPNAPRGTILLAPEQEELDVKTWRVDGYDRPIQQGGDEMRVILVRVDNP